MLQVFEMDVAKVVRDVAYVAMVVHVCCKGVFPMFHLSACSVGWFISLLVRKEVLLASLCERKILFRLEIYDRIRSFFSSRTGCTMSSIYLEYSLLWISIFLTLFVN